MVIFTPFHTESTLRIPPHTRRKDVVFLPENSAHEELFRFVDTELGRRFDEDQSMDQWRANALQVRSGIFHDLEAVIAAKALELKISEIPSIFFDFRAFDAYSEQRFRGVSTPVQSSVTELLSTPKEEVSEKVSIPRVSLLSREEVKTLLSNELVIDIPNGDSYSHKAILREIFVLSSGIIYGSLRGFSGMYWRSEEIPAERVVVIMQCGDTYMGITKSVLSYTLLSKDPVKMLSEVLSESGIR